MEEVEFGDFEVDGLFPIAEKGERLSRAERGRGAPAGGGAVVVTGVSELTENNQGISRRLEETDHAGLEG